MGDDVGGDARVDDGVGDVGAVVGEVVGEEGGGVVLAGYEADPLKVMNIDWLLERKRDFRGRGGEGGESGITWGGKKR